MTKEIIQMFTNQITARKQHLEFLFSILNNTTKIYTVKKVFTDIDPIDFVYINTTTLVSFENFCLTDLNNLPLITIRKEVEDRLKNKQFDEYKIYNVEQSKVCYIASNQIEKIKKQIETLEITIKKLS